MMKRMMVLALLLAPVLAAAADPPAEADGRININTATLDELTLLPGIGPSKARAIAEHRAKKPFKTPEDLLRVRGIGRGTFKQLRNLITVSGPTTLKAKPKRARR